jgi:hypothetical protein
MSELISSNTQKNSILENLNFTKDQVSTLVNNHREYVNYHRKPLNFSRLKHVVAFLLFSLALSLLYAIVASPIAVVFNIETESLTEPVAVPLFIGSIILYFICYRLFNNRQQKVKLVKHAVRINQIISEKEMILHRLDQESIVPSTYRNMSALNRFIQYFKDGRAETMKEAMNLYEQEVRHEEQLQEIQVMQHLQAATYQKADEAVRVGWMNYFSK